MAIVTQFVGFLLLILGLSSWYYTGAEELTALIPAFLGLPIGLLGLLAERNERARAAAMHVALVVALLGLAGTLPTALGTWGMSEASDTAVIESWLTAIVCAAYLALGVRSFVRARRSR